MARNKQLTAHIGRLSRSKVKSLKYLHKGLKKSDAPTKPTKPTKPEPQPFKEVEVGGEKNGQKRLVPTQKAATFYPAEDIRQPKTSRKIARPNKLRGSITPGTILILLAGRHKGKRVVFLKQLQSGLLLTTGPYSVNGVPLRRVNQAYVIATSTKLELGDLKLDKKINDSYFARHPEPPSRDKESEFFTEGKPKAKKPYLEARALDQKVVDKVVIEAMKKTKFLAKYLRESWGLLKGQHPHQLIF